MVDQELIALFGDEQLHIHATLGRRGDGVEQGIVGHKVRAADGNPVLGRVDQGVEQAQVVFGDEPGAAGHHLCGDSARFGVGRELQLGLQGLVRFAQPVRGENNVQGGHDRPAQARHQLHPFPAGPAVPGVVIGGLDQVLRAREGQFAVDHHDLAVVPQVRTAPLAVDGQQREHAPPLDLPGLEPFEEVAVALDPERADVVKQHSHFNAPPGGLLEGGQEVVGDMVRTHDVELGVDESFGFAHGLGHGEDRVRVAGYEVHGIAVHHGEGAQPAVQFPGGPHPLGPRVFTDDVGDRRDAGPHPGVDDLLLLPSAARELEVAEQQEEHQAQERDEEDAQQPGHGSGGAPVAGNNADGQDPDHQVRNAEQHHHPRRCGTGKRNWPQHWTTPRLCAPADGFRRGNEHSLAAAGPTKLET